MPPGWDEWHGFASSIPHYYHNYKVIENGVMREYGAGAEDYATDVFQRKAVSFIRHSREPFFLYFAPTAPHKPFTPAERHKRAPVPPAHRPPNHNEADVADKPAWVRSAPSLTPAQQREAEAIRKNQLRALRAVDDAVEALYATLRETGKLENTLILFTSDNGFAWGEHRRKGKNTPYEEAVRVPLVVSYPRLGGGIARQEKRLVLNIDLAPTLVALAQARGFLPRMDGRSLLPLLAGSSATWRTDFLLEYWPSEKAKLVPAFSAVRSEGWKYIEYETAEKELYDLKADPFELENLAGRREHAAVQQRLARRLVELKKE